MHRQQTRGVTAGRHAQAAARFFGMRLDRALADIKQPCHFLGLEVPGNQPQDFLLAPCQRLHPCRFVLHPASPLPLAYINQKLRAVSR
jgi:hypothetical protein